MIRLLVLLLSFKIFIKWMRIICINKNLDLDFFRLEQGFHLWSILICWPQSVWKATNPDINWTKGCSMYPWLVFWFFFKKISCFMPCELWISKTVSDGSLYYTCCTTCLSPSSLIYPISLYFTYSSTQTEFVVKSLIWYLLDSEFLFMVLNLHWNPGSWSQSLVFTLAVSLLSFGISLQCHSCCPVVWRVTSVVWHVTLMSLLSCGMSFLSWASPEKCL